MSRWKNVVGVFASTLGLVFTLAVLGGNTQPICGSSEPSSTVCLTDADCTADADATCDGAWACIESECQWQCTVQPVGCYSDNDCAEGTHCSVSDGVCNAPPDCPMCDVCFGSCVDDETPPATCQSDDQCLADQYCDFADCPRYGAAERMPCSPDSAGCVMPPPVCDGVCTTRPVVTGCTSDSECAQGEVCQLEQRCYAVDCADGTDCGAPMPCEAVGVCVPAPTGCWADDECPAGFQCVFTDACPPIDCKPGEPCPAIACQPRGTCEPIPHECLTDADCGEGFTCEPMYKCDPMTNCDAAGNCDDEKCLGSGGVCVPFQTSACGTVKCMAGTHCEERTECYDGCTSPDGQNLCDPATGVAPCSTWAECVPDAKGCTADYECPTGYACQFYPCDCGGYGTEGGAGEAPVDCYCEPYGQCVPVEPPGCTTDSDCQPGTHCEIDSWCGCAEGMDCANTDPNSWCIGGGVCVPDPQPLCLTDGDCAAGETCNALDVCILLDCASPECSYCHGYCVADQKACYADYDCPAGQVCQFSAYDANGVMACCPANTDQMCLMIYPSCEGVCVPAATEICWNGYDDDGDGLVDEGCGTQTECVSDGDCQWYETCWMPLYGGADPAAPYACCQPGQMCYPEMPPCEPTGGVCVLAAGYCWSNADCAAGQVCEGATTCPPGAYCLVAAGPGKCAPGNPGEVCGNNYDDDGDGLVDEGCEGACPDGTMCAAGEVCEEQVVCPDCYDSDPACLMPCMLQYVCVPEKPAACVVSGCSGQICAPEPMASTCEWLPWYACFGLAACEQQPTGACGWTPNPEFKQCMLDNGGY